MAKIVCQRTLVVIGESGGIRERKLRAGVAPVGNVSALNE